MEEIPQPSKWKRRTRRCLIALAWAVSVIALGYGVVDWQDRRAWNEYRQNYEAHIASLDLQTYTPKPIPDSVNFAATPFVQSWFTQANDTNFLYNRDTFGQAGQMMSTNHPPSWSFLDLVAWQEALAAVRAHDKKPKDGFQSDKLDLTSRASATPAVLEGLQEDEAALEELRTASARPDARYPIVYDMDNPWGILLPHLLKIKQTCEHLQVKACAELAVGQNEKAADDAKLMLYIADTIKDEPTLISYLVRCAGLRITMQVIWEGLAEHRWNEAQLEELQARLQRYNLLADLQTPLHAELAFETLGVDLLKKKGLGFMVDLASDQSNFDPWQRPLLEVFGRIAPSGWYDQEKLHLCQGHDDEFRGIMDESSKRFFPRQIAANASQIATFAKDNGLFGWGAPTHGLWYAIMHHEYIAALALPALARIPVKAAAAETAADQAAIGCALERYRLANGQFPDNLQALVPRFAARLPNDVITGDPYKYRRTDDGRFVLYSVGWNEKDDGGVPGKTMFDETEGDWVWEYPMEK